MQSSLSDSYLKTKDTPSTLHHFHILVLDIVLSLLSRINLKHVERKLLVQSITHCSFKDLCMLRGKKHKHIKRIPVRYRYGCQK